MHHRLVAAAIAAIVVLLASSAPAHASHSYGRVMCAGPYCRIVPAAEPRPHHRAATRHRQSRTHIDHHHRTRSTKPPRHAAPVTEVFDQDGRARPAWAAPLRATAKSARLAPRTGTAPRARPIGQERPAGASPIEAARRFLGGNPTGWGSLWCGRFMAMILPHAAARLPNPAWARDWERLPHIQPRVGAVAVLHRRHGGHVGLVTGFDARGNPILIAGNAGGNRVREYAVDARRVAAFVDPG